MKQSPTSDPGRPIFGAVAYGFAIVLVIISPALGLLAAAVATWQALLAGSILYMPLGFVLALVIIALITSHKRFDLALLGLVVVAAIAWFMADVPQQGQLAGGFLALWSRTGVMIGLLVATVLVLVLILAARRIWHW